MQPQTTGFLVCAQVVIVTAQQQMCLPDAVTGVRLFGPPFMGLAAAVLVPVRHADDGALGFHGHGEVVHVWQYDFDVVVTAGKVEGVADLDRGVDSEAVVGSWSATEEAVGLVVVARDAGENNSLSQGCEGFDVLQQQSAHHAQLLGEP